MAALRMLRRHRTYGVFAACAAALACTGATLAGVPGDWDVVAQGANVPGDSANDLGLARSPDGVLHVAWEERTGSRETIRHRSISAAGRVGPVSTIVSGWTEVSDPELVTEAGGRLRVYFSGRRSAESEDQSVGLLTATAPPSGASWSTAAVVHDRDFVEARNPSATVARDGTQFQTWYGASGIHLHRGLEADGSDRLFTAAQPLTEFGPTVVDDAAGRIWVAWCGFGANGGGLFVQRADPASGAPIGNERKLSGSSTPHQGAQVSTCNLERTAARRTPMVARVGGGVFIAGAGGYPTLSRVHVWRIDPSGQIPAGSFVVGADARIGHTTPTLAAAPDGRVWVAWLEATPGRATIAARRSNRLGTEWGEPVRVRATGNWLLGALNVAAQGGRLDVLGLMSSVGGGKSIQHTQLLPGLTLRHVRTQRRPDGRFAVTFRVSDAGDPLGGARVAAGSLSDLTGGNGLATLILAQRSGGLRVTASRAGYVQDTIGFRCC